MDSIGSMNGFRDDTAATARTSKNAHARRSDDQDFVSPFGEVLAGVFAQPPSLSAPVLHQETSAVQGSQSSQGVQSGQGLQTATPTNPSESKLAGNQNQATPLQAATAPEAATPATGVSETATLATVQGQNDSEGLLAQLAALSVDAQAETQAGITQTSAAQTAAPGTITNAATLAASRSNAGANAAAETDIAQGVTSEATPTPTNQGQTPSTLVSNDNLAQAISNKAKPVDIEVTVKATGQTIEPVSTTLDGAGTTSVINGQEVTAPANDQANRAPQLTPQTIPMLAATMMRRLESGSKQFTMRLDPPELGQVEVKLTVAPDKKVRAVVSADRPEALADLVRSARELVRALHEAGLDLEENGLTFQMNDPSSGGQQNHARDQQTAGASQFGLNETTNLEAEVQNPTDKAQPTNDPFQRWQRARIALTA